MNGGFNLERLELSGSEKNQFLELLNFAIDNNKKLSYSLFKKHLGLSKTQWDIFRLENLEKKVEWAY